MLNNYYAGGLIAAIAVEHCNLHKRIALKVILTIGTSPVRYVQPVSSWNDDIASFKVALRMIRWVGHIACIIEVRNAHKILV
jgi:hypothetical protein